MKKLKIIGIVFMIAIMLVPTAVDATNEYYSDSYMMYQYLDEETEGAKVIASTSHNQRYALATATVKHADGTGESQTARAGVTAKVLIWTNRYTHTHSRS